MSPEEHAKHLAEELALDQDREAAEAAVIRAERDLLDIAIAFERIEDQGTLKLDVFKDKHKTEGGLVFDEVRVTGNPYFLRDPNHCVVKRHWVEDNGEVPQLIHGGRGRGIHRVKDKGEFMLVHARDVLSEDGKNSRGFSTLSIISKRSWADGSKRGAGDGVLNLQQIRGAPNAKGKVSILVGSPGPSTMSRASNLGAWSRHLHKDGELKLFQSESQRQYSIIWASSCRISASNGRPRAESVRSTPSRPSRSTPSPRCLRTG